MNKFVMTVVIILLVYLCAYAVVNRVCKCIEHYTEWKYRSRIDLEWLNTQRMSKSSWFFDRKDGNRNERCERDSM